MNEPDDEQTRREQPFRLECFEDKVASSGVSFGFLSPEELDRIHTYLIEKYGLEPLTSTRPTSR